MVIRKSFKKSYLLEVKTLLLAALCSFGLMVFIHPDLFFFHRVSFIRNLDNEFCYGGVFTLLQNFYHGGIQLWNMYDQMPLAYYHLNGGLYTLSNIITAMLYAVLSPFFQSPSDAFQVIYSIFFQCPSFLVRTAGIYLLIRRFTDNRVILFLTCVLFNTALVPHLHLGLSAGDVYSYFPLLAHFVLRFFEDFKLKDFLLAVIVFTVAVCSNPLVAPGYFYQGMHFFILSVLGWCFIANREKLSGTFRSGKKLSRWKQLCAGGDGKRIILTALLCFFLLLPSVFMLVANWHDYEFDAGHSRFTNLFSVSEYFKRPIYFAQQNEFLWRSIDFSRNDWGKSWLFVGFSSVFLSLAGLVLGRDQRKWIFCAAMIFLWLINSPRDASGLSGLTHWINALTNPLKFLPRSFHMVGAFLISFLVPPLMALGMESLWSLKNRAWTRKDELKMLAMIVGLFFFLCLVFGQVPFQVKQYLMRSTAVILFGLLLLWKRNWLQRFRSAIFVVLIFLLFCLDAAGLSQYLRKVTDQMLVTSHRLPGLEWAGYVNLDDRNPKILPRRFHFSLKPWGPVPFYLSSDPVNMTGLYYQYTNLGKYFSPIDNYKPRHKAYARWPDDDTMLRYLEADSKILFEAGWAVGASEEHFKEIVNRGMSRELVMLDEEALEWDTFLLDFPGKLPAPPSTEEGPWKSINYSIDAAAVEEYYDLERWTIALPEEFPEYLSTTILSDDRFLLKSTLQRNEPFELRPVQGRPSDFFTFDVNNLATGKITVGLPVNFVPDGGILTLQYPLDVANGIERVWKNQPDRFGFDYRATRDGWLVFHYPYDPKWTLEIDGEAAKVYRINKSFLGTGIKAGKHKILLQYWPHTILRKLIGLSIVLLLLTVPFVVIMGLKTLPANRFS